MTECFSWLHLTDFHYGLNGQDCLWPILREPFLADIRSLRDKCGPWHAVLFTGDLAQSGQAAQFSEMQEQVLDRLWRLLEELGSSNAVLLAVPGNHDVQRPDPRADDAAIHRLLDKDDFHKIAETFWRNTDNTYRRVIDRAFQGYVGWWSSAPHRPRSGISDGFLQASSLAPLLAATATLES